MFFWPILIFTLSLPRICKVLFLDSTQDTVYQDVKKLKYCWRLPLIPSFSAILSRMLFNRGANSILLSWSSASASSSSSILSSSSSMLLWSGVLPAELRPSWRREMNSLWARVARRRLLAASISAALGMTTVGKSKSTNILTRRLEFK